MSRRRWWQLRRSRRSQRWALAIVILTVGAAVVAGRAAYQQLVTYPERSLQLAGDEVAVEIPSGTSLPGVLELLVERGVLTERDAASFKLFVLHKGAAGKITAGPHMFAPEMTPTELLEELTRRQPAREVTVTVPEGRNMIEVAGLLAKAGLGEVAAFESAMRDPDLLSELDITGESVEGYLFPDTYKFEIDATPEDVIRRLVKRHRQVYADLERRHRDAAERLQRQLGWDAPQIVTLASIVEKETGADHERPLIAGVFLNRLRFASFQPKLLQTDPTIIYGCTVAVEKSPACQEFEGRIRRIHLQDRENPYNTYTHEGLPPGPITNPGRDALEAVFAPKASRFLFFVARNDGTHEFSKSESEHERWVELYQRQGQVGRPAKAPADAAPE